MSFKEIKRMFNDLGSLLTEKKEAKNINKNIKKTYTGIKDSFTINLNEDAQKAWNNTQKQLKVDIQMNMTKRNDIVEEKVKGLNYSQRLDRNSNKLINDMKKSKLIKEFSVKYRIKKEYNKTKRLYKNESHRIVNKTKSFFGDKAKKIIAFDKIWICSFRNSREAHIRMHNQVADKEGKFHIDGFETEYPSGFGVARLDINCKCKVKFKRKKEKNESK